MKLTSDQPRLDRGQVKHVAKLANLPLTEEETEKYSEQLSKILDYIDQLNRADTSKVEPIFNTTERTNITHPDKPSINLTQEEALSNAKEKKNGQFVTKGVFSEE